MSNYTILLPLYNDWGCLGELLRQVDFSCQQSKLDIQVLVVDDCSFEKPVGSIDKGFVAIQKVSVIRLSRNVGHQRAIAMGLSYIHENFDTDGVLVMDSDGEDDPMFIPKLIEKSEEGQFQKVIFASRKKRSEGFVFRFFYKLFKMAFFILTGAKIKFGNFSFIPKNLLEQVSLIPDVHSHYAAAVLRSRTQNEDIETVRAKRIDGKSKMNFVGLVMHGLSAISVYSDIIGVRSIIFAVSIVLLTFSGILIVIGIKLFTNLAIPGWASEVVFLLFIALLQSLVLLVVFTFLVLKKNNNENVELKFSNDINELT